MNKHLYGMAGAFLGIFCLGLPALAQGTQPHKSGRYSFLDPKLESGQFTITQPKPDGSVVIEMYDAPLEPVLQAVAKLANRKLIISDEAKEKLKTYTGNTFKLTTPTLDAAFTSLTSGFSRGKVGKDMYLLVPREKSAAEIAAEKALKAKLKEKLQIPQLQEPEQYPNEPQQAPMNGRLYLLPQPLK